MMVKIRKGQVKFYQDVNTNEPKKRGAYISSYKKAFRSGPKQEFFSPANEIETMQKGEIIS